MPTQTGSPPAARNAVICLAKSPITRSTRFIMAFANIFTSVPISTGAMGPRARQSRRYAAVSRVVSIHRTSHPPAVPSHHGHNLASSKPGRAFNARIKLWDKCNSYRSSGRHQATESPRLESRCRYLVPSNSARKRSSSRYGTASDPSCHSFLYGIDRHDRGDGAGETILRGALCQPAMGNVKVSRFDFVSNRIAACLQGRQIGTSSAGERIEDRIAGESEHPGEAFGKAGRAATAAAARLTEATIIPALI